MSRPETRRADVTAVLAGVSTARLCAASAWARAHCSWMTIRERNANSLVTTATIRNTARVIRYAVSVTAML